MAIGAAILVGLEDRTRVVAPSWSSQLGGALSVDVSGALARATAAAGGGAEVHGDVEAVDERDVEEIHVVELVQGVLGQGVGRLAVAAALEDPAAVTRLAPPPSGPVEVAVGAGPDAGLRRARGHIDGPALPPFEPPAAAGDGRGPHGVGAVVPDVEDGGFSEGKGHE